MSYLIVCVTMYTKHWPEVSEDLLVSHSSSFMCAEKNINYTNSVGQSPIPPHLISWRSELMILEKWTGCAPLSPFGNLIHSQRGHRPVCLGLLSWEHGKDPVHAGEASYCPSRPVTGEDACLQHGGSWDLPFSSFHPSIHLELGWGGDGGADLWKES